MTYAPEVIEALAYLRLKAKSDDSQVSRAINVLDNAGVFAALDEQTDYASATEILAEAALASVPNTADPAEWGDTTSADMARHQGYDAASRLGKLERVPGTDILRPARTPRDAVEPHEHVYMDGHPEELCLYGSCTLTYREYREQR